MERGDIMVDPTFAVNDYNKPLMLTEQQTLANNFLALLLGKPGFFPSIPSLGINISQYLYRFEDELDIDGLKSRIAMQCTDFIPSINEGNFDIKKTTMNGRTLLIFQLPMVGDTNEYELALGVTTNSSGEVIYRFVENKKQIL